MKYYTLDSIMYLGPCYRRDKLEVYMKGRKRISLSGILNSKASDSDKVWLVVRLLPADKAVEFAKWCADSVSHLSNNWAARAAANAADARYAVAFDAAVAEAVDAAARGADTAYSKARKNQITQLKLIVKENKL